MTRSRRRDEKKGEQGGGKEGKLGRKDETETERKGRVDVGEKQGGKEIWGSKTLGKKQCALLHLVKGRKPC